MVFPLIVAWLNREACCKQASNIGYTCHWTCKSHWLDHIAYTRNHRNSRASSLCNHREEGTEYRALPSSAKTKVEGPTLANSFSSSHIFGWPVEKKGGIYRADGALACSVPKG